MANLTKEDVKKSIQSIDETINKPGAGNHSPVYGARKSATDGKSATGGMKESAFADSNRAQRRR